MKVAIIVESSMLPKPQPWRDCECMKEPIDLELNKGIILWIKNIGDVVEKGDIVCEGEVDKKVVEIASPCGGILIEKCIENEYVFGAGDVIGYVESK